MPLEGFENAPIVKAMLFSTIGTFLIQSYAASAALALRVETAKIVLNSEYWRFLTSQLTFQSSGELMVALPVMYIFRQFERQLGSRKLALHVIVSIFFSITLQMCALYFMPTLGYVSPGPYAFIFAMFPKYYMYVPKLFPKMFSVFGLTLSDKVLCYLLGAQLACNDGRHSLVRGVLEYWIFIHSLTRKEFQCSRTSTHSNTGIRHLGSHNWTRYCGRDITSRKQHDSSMAC